MNVRFFSMAALMACAPAFMSCSDDDEEGNGNPPSTTTAKPTVKYGLTIADDVLALADVVVTYWNKSGAQETDTLKQTEWEYTFEPTASQQIGFSYATSPKQNFDELIVDSVLYHLGCGYSYYWRLSAPVNTYKGHSSNGNELSIPGSKVKDYFSENSMNRIFSATYNKESNSFTEWEIQSLNN